ncbi:hypothetical protein V499_04324 [Pseudogymnoascus sp. VKM F-103]|nr:hypothetical protein V499_04324 [Pseudogymnoascus sp. VKM F-103]
MGLAEPRKRLKLSKDPNNTTWTKDTTGFGHKIMKSQGWTPGEYLGIKDAPHAEFHTEANASHIRVVLKDDNLGIGAKKGSGLEQGECVGLDVFQNLLGRLNGRDEDEMEREQKSREDLKRAIYSERKWGSIRFVSGGFLIGDKIQDLIDGEADRLRQLAVDSSSSGSEDSSDSGSDSDSDTTPEPVVMKEKKSKKSKKSSKEIEVEVSEASVDSENGKSKSKKKRKLADVEEDGGVSIVDKTKKSKKSKKSESEEDASESKDRKSKSKKDKKEKKDKKDKKDKKKKSKSKSSEDSLDSDSAVTSKSSKSKSKSKKSKSEKTASDSSDTTPVVVEISSRPILLGGRHAVRSRNIAQKRLAAMNSASLNEIFMIKG